MKDILKISHGGNIYCGVAIAAQSGVPAEIIGAAVKLHAKHDVTAFAENYRTRLANTSAGKLAEYRIKEEIARDPDAASQAELELLDREALARGITRIELIGQINAQTTAFRQIALLIGVVEAEANAAISAIPDGAADIEAQLTAALSAAKSEAAGEYQNALSLMVGA